MYTGLPRCALSRSRDNSSPWMVPLPCFDGGHSGTPQALVCEFKFAVGGESGKTAGWRSEGSIGVYVVANRASPTRYYSHNGYKVFELEPGIPSSRK